ncbi:hypothetical protein BgiBS90_001950, partial [Biomphalaria glabrata]
MRASQLPDTDQENLAGEKRMRINTDPSRAQLEEIPLCAAQHFKPGFMGSGGSV